jgi:hypothetical protein
VIKEWQKFTPHTMRLAQGEQDILFRRHMGFQLCQSVHPRRGTHFKARTASLQPAQRQGPDKQD